MICGAGGVTKSVTKPLNLVTKRPNKITKRTSRISRKPLPLRALAPITKSD